MHEHETCHRAGIDYEIYPDDSTGLMLVYADGAKIGQSQTVAGARLIRRNHARQIERQTLLTWSIEEGRFL